MNDHEMRKNKKQSPMRIRKIFLGIFVVVSMTFMLTVIGFSLYGLYLVFHFISWLFGPHPGALYNLA